MTSAGNFIERARRNLPDATDGIGSSERKLFEKCNYFLLVEHVLRHRFALVPQMRIKIFSGKKSN